MLGDISYHKATLQSEGKKFIHKIQSFIHSFQGGRELTSMWMRGALLMYVVYQHSPWIQKRFYRGKVVFPGIVYVLRKGSQASQLTEAMGKGSFYIILFKTQRFLC